ncbi:hypothetical protein BS78_04G157600 [Paspalum vaginatum]|nr:hypothetical protein BS78_04G157600 [Paspalum vaginatum]
MAQDAANDHQGAASADGDSFAPWTTVTCTLTLRPSAENDNGGSSAGSPVAVVVDASKGKDIVVPDVPKEERGSADRSCAKSDGSKGKLPAAAEVPATGDDSGGSDDSKGKGLAADGGEPKMHIIMERERRKRMKDMFSGLQALMPHMPEKSDKATIVGEAISYIKSLETTVTMLENLKKEKALARQAATKAAAAAAAASSRSRPVPLQTAHGMAALSNPVVPAHARARGRVVPQLQPAVPPPPLAVTTGPAGFQTWAAPNVVLSVVNSDAIINLCAPRRPRMVTMVLSVLSKHGIDVVSAQVSADGIQSLFITINGRVTTGGENPSAEDVCKLAVSEIMVWMST